jgi:hypothetical protein
VAGATTISITSAAGLIVGTPLRIGSGGTGETASITNVSGTTLTLGTPLASAHASASVVTPLTCRPLQSNVTGPDGRKYRVDSYIVWYCALGNLTSGNTTNPGCSSQSRPVKQVTVVVRDGVTTTKTYVRVTSTFDQAT